MFTCFWCCSTDRFDSGDYMFLEAPIMTEEPTEKQRNTRKSLAKPLAVNQALRGTISSKHRLVRYTGRLPMISLRERNFSTGSFQV